MRIWLVNPFDPLPGEREQLGRYAYLAACLRDAGHEVTWWSSSFSHRFKRRVDRERVRAAAEEWRIGIELLDAPPYAGNVSFARLANHRALGRDLKRRMESLTPPDVILASSPPLETADVAAAYGRQRGVPVIVDIQDQWPDNFARVFPRFARPLAKLALWPYYRTERHAYRAAAGIIGVARGYVNRGVGVGGAKALTGSFPLGVDLADVRAAMADGAKQFAGKWPKPAGQTWLLYSGSLSHNYDFLTPIRAAAAIQRDFGDRARFFITGTGELADAAHAIVRESALRNVTITGFVEFPEYAYLLSQADVGFNASFPDALIYLPNKIFYYFAAGAAVLNTIPGECAQIVAAAGCGLTYAAGDVAGCEAAIRAALGSPEKLAAMKAASRRLAEDVYDRRIIYAGLVRFLENAASTASRRVSAPHSASGK